MHYNSFLHGKDMRAFTITEMSIVVLIIGLLTAGVAAGSKIIETAKIKTIIDESDYYKQAIMLFYTKYNAMPGDFIGATRLWYNASTCPGTNDTPGKCNGDNSGVIINSGGTDSDEQVRVWQHLNLAGILPEPYIGIHTTASQNDIGINVPSTKYGYAGWFINDIQINGLGYQGNYLHIGTFTPNNVNVLPFYTTLHAAALDRKIDDGYPGTGYVRSAWLDFGTNYGGYPAGAGCGGASGYYINNRGLICATQFELRIR